MDGVKSWILIGSAPNADLSVLSPLISRGIQVICADGGMQSAQRAGIKPCFFVGDLDSGNKPDDVNCMILPTEKDYTDIHTAINWALSRQEGSCDIYLAGCTNGRADHYFANVCLLEMICENGSRGVILDSQNRIFYHSGGTLELERSADARYWNENKIQVPEDFKYVSVIPLDDVLSGVTLKGLKYPLDNAKLMRNCPIGVSNELADNNASVTVKEGRSLLILSKDV